MNGISYFASNQWFVAQHKPPHLATICVWEGAANWYREFARHGGDEGVPFFPSDAES